VAHPSLPVKSVKELIALAKTRPDELNYGSVGPGTPNQIAAELFKAMSRVRIVEVAYKGGSLAMVATMGGQVQLMFASAASALPQVKSGRVRALGVTSAEPTAAFPGVPTIASAGVPGYEAVTLFGVFAPAKTPGPIVARLNRELVQILAMPDIREKFLTAGNDAVGSTPEQLAGRVASEMTKVSKLVKSGHLKPES
jgi:tripartite-type tricarboxylate transporter receptor subunit TctC